MVPSVRVPTSAMLVVILAWMPELLTVDGDLVTSLGEGLAVAAAETLV